MNRERQTKNAATDSFL